MSLRWLASLDLHHNSALDRRHKERMRVFLTLFVAWMAFTDRRVNCAEDRHVVLISVDGLPGYLLDDPQVSMPTIREIARRGAVLTKGMSVSNPSVTWPNHTTLVTGVHPARHGVLFNGIAERSAPGFPVQVNGRHDKAELVAASTLFEIAHRARLRTAAINWPCTRGMAEIDLNWPDVPEAWQHTTPQLKSEMLETQLVSPEQNQQMEKLPVLIRDRLWTEAACHAIRQHKPHLLMLHLLNLDSTHHKYGPKTPAGYTAVAYADTCIERVVEAIEDAGLRDRTVIFVVADHGFMAIPKTILPNVALRRAGLLTVEGTRMSSARVHVIPEGGIGMVYLTVPEKSAEDRQTVRELFSKHEGIAEIIEADQYAKYHLPQPSDNPRMADMILVGKDGFGFAATATGEDQIVTSTATLGTHGFLSTHPNMNAFCAAAGVGIRTGATRETASNVDIAPTIARLLNLDLPEVDGRVLEEFLDAK